MTQLPTTSEVPAHRAGVQEVHSRRRRFDEAVQQDGCERGGHDLRVDVLRIRICEKVSGEPRLGLVHEPRRGSGVGYLAKVPGCDSTFEVGREVVDVSSPGRRRRRARDVVPGALDERLEPPGFCPPMVEVLDDVRELVGDVVRFAPGERLSQRRAFPQRSPTLASGVNDCLPAQGQ